MDNNQMCYEDENTDDVRFITAILLK